MGGADSPHSRVDVGLLGWDAQGNLGAVEIPGAIWAIWGHLGHSGPFGPFATSVENWISFVSAFLIFCFTCTVEDASW